MSFTGIKSLMFLLVVVAAVVLRTTTTDAFVVTTKVSPVLAPSHIQNRYLTQQLYAVDDKETTTGTVASSENNTPKKRRRKRKAPVDESSSSSSTPQSPSQDLEDMLVPRDEDPVELQVKNVQELVGDSTKSATTNKPAVPFPVSDATPSTSNTAASEVSNSNSNLDDSLAQLLEDAKRMQADGDDASSAVGASGEEGSLTVKQQAANIISTIVTADFFVVCGFLLWFLLGIFCSTVLKDDTVQIAFNSNFQAFVQPALGVLMIGAIAGNFFKEEGEE